MLSWPLQPVTCEAPCQQKLQGAEVLSLSSFTNSDFPLFPCEVFHSQNYRK